MIQFTIPGVPVGKGRPRAARRGKGITLYTPAKTASYESLVALAGQQAMAGCAPYAGPMGASMDIFLPVPASWSKERQQAALLGQELPAKKPDMDNVIKAIFDALNGIVWLDDVQVTDMGRVRKRYSLNPGVVLQIWEVKQ
ncbi:RusA family crossover junction endodeoxyribonuclease [Kerstersia gyiorum]|uniref:RusA family crossover junction endodeoxyribonuclease n=1 Tax=Kerstersia gyiorum TaxID=206506 RepID=UPI00209F5699|nr:RusA family crossover junction endodeoxyribonuclease [Kerstersia gyiorum]MCP1679426.1 Holliday junction resolvase RusA-like endonuclease [Kerstersia gyiorum]MCP1823929.1 Holliday junction resolvase RusA-like endonuclease [Kerstersia gyiorum]MCP1827370.1 Holliday junction resolvase RusA-like endonuclease [Kerstersia gyiorum]MCW2448981.1 Holliday junction resolvase RusA-like endonuclease [Kerstersia gyiorum]